MSRKEAPRPFQGASRAAPGKSGLHARGEGERVLALEVASSCPTLCDPIDGSPPGSPVPGILQARKELDMTEHLSTGQIL